MKTKLYIATYLLMLSVLHTKADDLTFNVKNTVKGSNNGAIDLTLAGGTGPYVINWTGPNGFTSKSEDIDNIAAGTYTITVTDNYCGKATATVIVKDVATGIDEMSAEQITLFPNPASTELTIIVPEPMKNYDLNLLNSLGETVLMKTHISVLSINLSISTLQTGFYFIQLTKDGNSYMKKIVKY